jgi:protease PrsW
VSVATGRVRPVTQRTWLRIFAAGLALWVASVVVTFTTRNANLIPTLILVGSFLVPVSFVAWAFENWRDEHVTTELVVQAFVVGGLLGVLGASLLEAYLLHPSPLLFVGVGLIEEAVKLAALALITRHMTRRHTRDGIVLGAAVGFGFAAFETAGYAFNAMLTVQGMSLTGLLQTELLRSVLAPLGHGLWTAILGGVLFRESRGGPFRVTGALVRTFLWVALLHALWDSMHDVAVTVTFLLTGTAWQYRLLSVGYLPEPTPEQVHLFTLLSFSGLALVSALGIATLVVCWRNGENDDAERVARRSR